MENENINAEKKPLEVIRKEVKERLVHVFGMRLKTLIDLKIPSYQEEIVEHFLLWMEELSKIRGNHNQYKMRLDDIHKILYFKNETGNLQERSNSIGTTAHCITNLCSYVEFLYNQLAEQVCNDEEQNGDIRKIIGDKFKEKMQNSGKKYSNHDIYIQLNVATLHRNTFFHQHKSGDSTNYKGFELLIGYDILMACLLYSFYKMVFDNPQ